MQTIGIRASVAQFARRQEDMFDVLQQQDGPTNHRHGMLSNSNVNAANSHFTGISGDQNTSAVHNTIINTHSGGVVTISYTGHHDRSNAEQYTTNR
jgi:hypothetical protein